MPQDLSHVCLADREVNKLLVGRAFVELNDFSEQTFKTDDLSGFVDYIKSLKKKAKDFSHPVFIEADENKVTAFKRMISTDPRNEIAIAECSLSISKRLDSIIRANGNWISADKMEELLKSLRNYTTPEGLELLDNIMDLSISKITKIRKTKSGGNYTYSVSRESSGADDFKPPKQLTFDVPIFNRFESHFGFRFDFDFDYKEIDGKVDLLFKIENLNIDDELLTARRAIVMDEFISKIDEVEAFWGHRRITNQDDAWKYKSLESF